MIDQDLFKACVFLADRNGRTFSRARGPRADLFVTADRFTGEDAFIGTLEEIKEWEQGYTVA